MVFSHAQYTLPSLLLFLCLTQAVFGLNAMTVNRVVPLSRYLYVGSIGGNHSIWMELEPAGEDGQKGSMFGPLKGSYRYTAVSYDNHLELQGEVAGDQRLALTEWPASSDEGPRASPKSSGRFMGHFSADFGEADGEWISADKSRRMPFKLRCVARYEQRSEAYTTREDCSEELGLECGGRSVPGTRQCEYNTRRQSEYPVWEGPAFASLNQAPTEKLIPTADSELSTLVSFNAQAPDQVSEENRIILLHVAPDLVSTEFRSSEFNCGAMHQLNSTSLSSYVQDANGSLVKLRLEQVIAPHEQCKAALRKALFAAGEEQGISSAADANDNFALVPTGLLFVYDSPISQSGFMEFIPFMALPAYCILRQR